MICWQVLVLISLFESSLLPSIEKEIGDQNEIQNDATKMLTTLKFSSKSWLLLYYTSDRPVLEDFYDSMIQ